MAKVSTLDELRDEVAAQVPFLKTKTFSHNLIALSLHQIADHYGTDEANRAIRDYKLDQKGWSEQTDGE